MATMSSGSAALVNQLWATRMSPASGEDEQPIVERVDRRL
jgi:hypothetical protein